MSATTMLFLSIIVCLFSCSSALEKRYRKGEKVELTLDSIKSYHTQLGYSSEPFRHDGESDWAFTSNRRTDTTSYKIHMLKEVYCETLPTVVDDYDVKEMIDLITHGYRYNWRVDNLPVALQTNHRGGDGDPKTRYAGGIPSGFLGFDEPKIYVFNHVNIVLDYHDNGDDTYSIVVAAVEPLSMHRERNPNRSSCPLKNRHFGEIFIDQYQVLASGVRYTYDVTWRESEKTWKERWRIYLTEDYMVPLQVHWYSMTNSLVAVTVMAGLLLMILLRNVRNDLGADDERTAIQGTESSSRAQELEEKGWKLIESDLFGPPTVLPAILVASCGTGAQLLCTVLLTTTLLALGWIDPTGWQASVRCMLLSFGPFGLINGIVTGRLGQTFELSSHKSSQRWSIFAFPLTSLVMFTGVNTLALSLSSTTAMPLPSLLRWSGVVCTTSAVFTFAGTQLVQHCGLFSAPKIAKLPKTLLFGMLFHRSSWRILSWRAKGCIIVVAVFSMVVTIALAVLWCLKRCLARRNWWSSTYGGLYFVSIGAIFALAVIYVEFFFLLVAAWMGQYYNSFGFLLMVTGLEVLTGGLVAILFGYFQLCNEGLFSWWWQFGASGGVSIFMLLYSILWYPSIQPTGWYAHVVYFGFMTWASLAVGLMMGFVGVMASVWFVNKSLGIAEKSIQDETSTLVELTPVASSPSRVASQEATFA